MANHQLVHSMGLAPGPGRRCHVIERQDFPVIDHQHFDPWIVKEEQRAARPMNVFQRRRAGAVQAQGGHSQLECRRGPGGDRQLRGAQHRQGVATVTGTGLDRQHLEVRYLIHTASRHCQALDQQLQRSSFGTGKKTQQALQHLLIDIVHRLIMDAGHFYLPDAHKFDIAQQLHAQRKELSGDDLVTEHDCQMLALKFSGQDLNGLDVTNVLNSVCAEETPGWQGFFRLRSTS